MIPIYDMKSVSEAVAVLFALRSESSSDYLENFVTRMRQPSPLSNGPCDMPAGVK